MCIEKVYKTKHWVLVKFIHISKERSQTERNIVRILAIYKQYIVDRIDCQSDLSNQIHLVPVQTILFLVAAVVGVADVLCVGWIKHFQQHQTMMLEVVYRNQLSDYVQDIQVHLRLVCLEGYSDQWLRFCVAVGRMMM